MTHVVLSRKWRPKTFKEVIGQDHIVRTLQDSLASDRVGHAYLFTGTRGVGKTTIARIFSKALRCLTPDSENNFCGTCKACEASDVDIIEIDGASNNSVENVRNLISNVQYLPTTGKYKVYIIDEVHMLSTSAFNALLKTIEEPPEHVKFLFATTEPHKLLETILSRCIRLDFKALTESQIATHLEMVCKSEGVELESPKLLLQIAKSANGSVRDSLSFLETVVAGSQNRKITFESVELSLGLSNLSHVENLTKALIDGDFETVQKIYHSMLENGVFLQNVVRSIQDELFELIESSDVQSGLSELIWIYEKFSKDTIWAMDSMSSSQVIEVILKKLTLRREFMGSSTGVIQTSPQKKSEVKSVAPDPTLELKPAPVQVEDSRTRSYEDFLVFVGGYSPALKANLEHGNLVDDYKIEEQRIDLKIGFKKSSSVFAEYFTDQEIRDRLIRFIKEYFKVEKVDLAIELIEEEVQEQSGFETIVDKQILKEKKADEVQVNEFKNNPLVRKAEEIFNTKVNDIILKKD
ncbi:MAG: DNA polymerase III subunit gamma/tau [Bacteriovoracaceae bacterium]